MKPRTKIEKQFAEWAGKLPPLDERRKEWAKRLFKPQALYYSRRGNNCEFWCQCCGHIEPTLGKWLLTDCGIENWECPACGADCEVLPQYSGGFGHNYNPRTRQYSKAPSNVRLVTLVTTFKGVQVFRTFEVTRHNSRRENDERGRWRTNPTEYLYEEVFQNWVLESGREIITSRGYGRSFSGFQWHYGSDWGVNHHNGHCGGQYVFEDVYEVADNFFFPGKRLLPVLRRNGMSTRFIGLRGVDPAKMAVRLLTDNRFEEVVKLGQLPLAWFFLEQPAGLVNGVIHAIRICSRMGYKVQDARAWVDYVDDLEFLGLDTHSPHYLCPKDLYKAHERTTRRRERIEERRREEERAREAKKWEERYAVAKAPFLGIVFGDDAVTISVLQTVEDVRLEGKAMHHCVFANGYYKHHDRVLLSAKDMEGNRLETIEIGLDPFKVLQSRGLQNRLTEKHDQIVALCNANMNLFRRAVPRMTVPLHLVGENANFYRD
jgi:hypothetical protein